MGRVPTPQSSDQTPQGYPNQHENPLSPPPPPPPQDDNYIQSTRSYVSQSQEDTPSPEKPASYPPPHQSPAAYPPPPHQSQTAYPQPHQSPAAYPPPHDQSQTAYPQPHQSPAAYPPPHDQSQTAYPQPHHSPAAYPPQSKPVQFPPQSEAVEFPPQKHQPVQFPPQQNSYTPQSYTNYTNIPNAPQNNGVPVGYQKPVQMDGIAIGSQYLAPTQGWSNNNGLFDCAEDPENALITACFPCITFGQIAEIVDNGQTSCATSGLIYAVIAAFIYIPCIMSCSYRTKIRNRYGLMETPAPDWVTHCFCEWCALCQEYRELKARGLDPAIGWQGNMEKNQQQYPPMNPPMNQRMI